MLSPNLWPVQAFRISHGKYSSVSGKILTDRLARHSRSPGAFTYVSDEETNAGSEREAANNSRSGCMDDLSIALPIFEGAEEQDVVGPFEMLIAMGGRGRWAAIPRYFLALLTCVTMLGAERGPSLSARATKRRGSESRNETTNCRTP